MDATKILGILAGALVLVVPVIKWLISDWYKKSKEIEELKRSQTKTALDRLESDLGETKGYLAALRAEIIDHKRLISHNSNQMDDLSHKIEHTTDEMLEYSKNLKEHMATEIKTEVKKLGDQLIMLRNKRASGTK